VQLWQKSDLSQGGDVSMLHGSTLSQRSVPNLIFRIYVQSCASTHLLELAGNHREASQEAEPSDSVHSTSTGHEGLQLFDSAALQWWVLHCCQVSPQAALHLPQ